MKDKKNSNVKFVIKCFLNKQIQYVIKKFIQGKKNNYFLFNFRLTTNVKRISRKTRKEIRYDKEYESDDISCDSESDKDYYADKDETQDETEKLQM